MEGVEFFGQMGGKPALAVAPKRLADTATQNTFVGRHPMHTQLMGDRDRFFRNAALAWPNALGADAKYLFVQIEAAEDLIAGILGMTEAVLRKRKTRG